MFKPSLEDLLKSSVRSILKNKGRTILTSLGIIIGVTSVILLTSIGNGLKSYINDQFDSLGANTIFISPGKIFNSNGGFSNSSAGRYITTTFNLNDISRLKRGLRGSTVIPVTQTTADFRSAQTTKKAITLIGSTYQYGEASDNLPSTGNGRWFTKEEADKRSEVVVLGNTLATDLFPVGDPVGKKVIVNSKNLRIIGVIDKKGGSFGGPDTDNYAYTSDNLVFSLKGNQNVNTILIKAPDKNSVSQVKETAKDIMLQKYDEDSFSVFDSSQLLNSINSIIGILTVGLSGIAAISLVVGGIGIMNIMLVTVSERTKEIGLRKAIGAYPRAILFQFLIEAIILSSVGGFIGVTLGALGTFIINNFFPAKITISSIVVAFGVSAIVGIVFGVEPARRASKLSPIEALRYE